MSKLRNRGGQYTTIPIAVLKRRDLSLKARGLLCTLLSLPDGWDYSEKGLCAILPDGLASVRSGLKELEAAGYLRRTLTHADKGKFAGYDWEISDTPLFDFPKTGNPKTGNPKTGNPKTGNRTQDNNQEDNNQEDNNQGERAAPPPTPPQKKEPPTVEQVAAYCAERRNGIDAQLFCDYYASRGWGRVADWKAAVRTWEKRQKPARGYGRANGPEPAQAVTPGEQAKRDKALEENQRQLQMLLEEDERRQRAAMEGREST